MKTPHRTGWIKNPKVARRGETIGGGHFVFRRGDDTKRIRPANWPFEYGTVEDAAVQAAVLAHANPGYVFDVLKVVTSVTVAKIESEAA